MLSKVTEGRGTGRCETVSGKTRRGYDFLAVTDDCCIVTEGLAGKQLLALMDTKSLESASFASI
jgi:hypothetical protein